MRAIAAGFPDSSVHSGVRTAENTEEQGLSGYRAAQTAFTSVYISRASLPISRPQPDCL